MFSDGYSATHAKFLFGFHLGGQSVTIPSEPPIHALAEHRLISGNYIFHVPREEMTVMGEAISEWWAVIKDVFVVLWSGINGILESVVFSPTI